MVNRYKVISNAAGNELYCNCCGQKIARGNIVGTHADYLHIEKLWGYFSCRDLTKHSFNICERCYNEWIESFMIPLDDCPTEDVTVYSEEEIDLLCAAYQREWCK